MHYTSCRGPPAAGEPCTGPLPRQTSNRRGRPSVLPRRTSGRLGLPRPGRRDGRRAEARPERAEASPNRVNSSVSPSDRHACAPDESQKLRLRVLLVDDCECAMAVDRVPPGPSVSSRAGTRWTVRLASACRGEASVGVLSLARSKFAAGISSSPCFLLLGRHRGIAEFAFSWDRRNGFATQPGPAPVSAPYLCHLT
jgi:hypothetical protein